MKILIAYASSEGQTGKIVKAIASQCRDLGHETVLFNTTGLPGDWQADDFDKIILAGSVHQEHHQESLEIFVLANVEELKAKPVLFISVSLAAAFENGQEDARSYVKLFAEATGWQPGSVLLVAGAVKRGEYGYYKNQILKHVVLKAREQIDPDSDHEFTDWQALERDIAAFVGA